MDKSVLPACEPLESRRLLSAARLTDAGVFRVLGDDNVDDRITVRRSGDQLVAVINGQERRRVDADDVEFIFINGRSGNDVLRIDNSGADVEQRVKMFGKDGDDRLDAGNAAVNFIKGHDGDDLIDGRGLIRAGAGNDNIDASNFADTIFGDAGRDSLDAENGNDVLFGGADNDTVEGDIGNDTCFGDDGDDRVEGGFGDDQLYGGAGDDSVFGDDGDDTLWGGDDIDSDINGNEGDDEENEDEDPGADDLIDQLEDDARENQF